jgi:glutathione synthase/RimK-type ligase-like ATP-grasp enzyme
MTGRVRILPYLLGSQGAKALSESLGVMQLRTNNSRFTPRQGDIIFNWGLAKRDMFPAKVYNKPEAVRNVTNKLRFFQAAQGGEGFQTLPYTTDRNEAAEWPVCVARTILDGHEGAGIVITENGEEPPRAPLYTKYVKKKAEYRIHVAFGQIIDMQRKIRDPNREPEDWRVRSYQNGFIFARNSGLPSDAAQQAALDAMDHFELDYGALDILETKDGSVYIIEINSAPGLEGTTLEKYTEAFQQEIEARRRYNRINQAPDFRANVRRRVAG